MNETWLAHHGIPGMRWGFRRFQNEDGSLTAKGRQRYGVGDMSHDRELMKDQRDRILGQGRHQPGANNPINRAREALLDLGKSSRNVDALKRPAKENTKASDKKQNKEVDDEKTQARKALAKKIAIGSAVVAGTCLAAYGAHKYGKYLKSAAGKDILDRGTKVADELMKQSQERLAEAAAMYNSGKGRGHSFEIASNKALELKKSADSLLKETQDHSKDVSSSVLKSYRYLRDQKKKKG